MSILEIPSGLYKLKKQNGEECNIWLNKSQARFMYNAYIRLGWDSIELIEERHYLDIPKVERL